MFLKCLNNITYLSYTYICLIIFVPAFFLRKKGILILYQSQSVVRLSVCPSVRPSVTFLVNASPHKPFDIATLNFVPRKAT